MQKHNFFKTYFYEYPKFFFHWLKVISHLAYGSTKVLRLSEPRVTIFGGSRVTLKDPYAKEAFILSKKLAEKNISVLTGGGPGIMEAANCGAAEIAKEKKKKMSIAISLKNGFSGEKLNMCSQENILVDHLFERKYLLIKYSVAFIVFPGGYGTLDELSELLTLMESQKMPCLPIILFGKSFWQPCLNWVEEFIAKKSFISKRASDLISVTDDVNEALDLIHKACTYYPDEKEKKI